MYFLDKASISKPFHALGPKTTAFQVFNAQKLDFNLLLKDKISIRAIQIVDGKVYYVGTDSKLGYVHLKDTIRKKQVRLSKEKLEFRTLAHYDQLL